MNGFLFTAWTLIVYWFGVTVERRFARIRRIEDEVLRPREFEDGDCPLVAKMTFMTHDGVAPLSYPKIGRLLGGLNHATVILAERRGEKCPECREKRASRLVTWLKIPCSACSGTGKLPLLTWDAYMAGRTPADRV